jgi:hypothetical protein
MDDSHNSPTNTSPSSGAISYFHLSKRLNRGAAQAAAIRTFDWGNGRAASDRQLAEGSPVLVVLGTDDDSREAWIRTGEALGRMLLLATLHGLSASFLNQPIEIPELRQKLVETLDLAGSPQLLLRLGYGPQVPPTPRRDLEDVLLASPTRN